MHDLEHWQPVVLLTSYLLPQSHQRNCMRLLQLELQPLHWDCLDSQ